MFKNVILPIIKFLGVILMGKITFLDIFYTFLEFCFTYHFLKKLVKAYLENLRFPSPPPGKPRPTLLRNEGHHISYYLGGGESNKSILLSSPFFSLSLLPVSSISDLSSPLLLLLIQGGPNELRIIQRHKKTLLMYIFGHF